MCGAGGQECAACGCPTGECVAGACAPQSELRSVSLSGTHGCYVLPTGELFCAGRNHRGQLGTGLQNDVAESVPAQVDGDWSMVSSGTFYTCGLRDGDSLLCWGDNHRGQSGRGDASGTPSPSRVLGSGSYDYVQAAGLTTVARQTDGTWVGFGANDSFQLNDPIERQLNTPTPIRVEEGEQWRWVHVSRDHGCGISDMGRLYCWGASEDGQTGQVDPAPALAQLVSPQTDWALVLTAEDYTCAMDTAGVVYCMGDNREGLLGRTTVGSASNRLEPTDASARFERLYLGPGHACAFDAAGQATCWGNNDAGEFGYGDETPPEGFVVRAPRLDGATQMSLGTEASFATLADGNHVWGTNDMTSPLFGHGRLALGDFEDRASPTPLCIEAP